MRLINRMPQTNKLNNLLIELLILVIGWSLYAFRISGESRLPSRRTAAPSSLFILIDESRHRNPLPVIDEIGVCVWAAERSCCLELGQQILPEFSLELMNFEVDAITISSTIHQTRIEGTA